MKYKEYLFLELNKKFLEETMKFDLQDFENPYIYDVIQRAEQEIGIRPFNLFFSFLSISLLSISALSNISHIAFFEQNNSSRIL